MVNLLFNFMTEYFRLFTCLLELRKKPVNTTLCIGIIIDR